MSSESHQTEESPLPTTSLVLRQAPPELFPKVAVACMQCPMALWQLEDKSLRCYCRVLYRMVWETTKPGKIRACDAPLLAAQAAAEEAAKGE